MSVRPEVLDFAPCGIQNEPCPQAVKKQMGVRLIQALERDGCVYIINTGLPEEKVRIPEPNLFGTFYDGVDQVK